MYHLTKKQSSKFLREKKLRNVWIAGLALISVLTWTAALSKLTQLNILTIQNIDVIGTDDVVKGDIEAAALHAMDGDYLNLFSRANSFIYPLKDIKNKVKESSARVKNVTVSREGLQSLVVKIEEKTPVALFCTNLPEWNGSSLNLDADQCLFADETGLAYKNAPSISGRLYNRYYISESTTSMDRAKFKSLQDFYDGVQRHDIEVEGLLIKPGGEYELYVSNNDTPASTVVVYFNDHNNLETELSNLISFWSNMLSKATQKGEKLKFDSIDLRYGSNVFYRLI
jgi:hypothetical protein